MFTYLSTLVLDGLHLIAPSLCPACEEPIPPRERSICEACRASLEAAPYPEEIYQDILADYEPDELALSAIGALYTFEKEGAVQRIVHALKYRGCRALGRALGEELGLTMQIFPEFSDAGIDLILPVPLHRARLRERGYNQAEEIARGVATAWNVEIRSDVLKRSRHTASQTKLSATARRTNVAEAFTPGRTDLRGRRILLCDDVFTTGSTLNACASRLLDAGAESVSAAALARDALTA